MLTSGVKIWLAVVACLVALLLLFFARDIQQGTGLIIATLAAGAGYLVRDINDEARKVRSICQAHAALIEAHFEEISDALSHSELARMLAMAPAIAGGTEPEAIGSKPGDPFASLPDVRDHLHLLSPHTVQYIWKWRARGTDLFQIYDLLGTKALSATPEARLNQWFDWVKQYRDEYRDIGYTALLAMREDAAGLDINVQAHERAGARKVVPAPA